MDNKKDSAGAVLGKLFAILLTACVSAIVIALTVKIITMLF